jgi:hypothetical protein
METSVVSGRDEQAPDVASATPEGDLAWLVANATELFYRVTLAEGAATARSWFPSRNPALASGPSYGVTSDRWAARVAPADREDYALFRHRVLSAREGSHATLVHLSRRDGSLALVRESITVDTDGAGQRRLRGLISEVPAGGEAQDPEAATLRDLARAVLHRLGNETMLVACNCDFASADLPRDDARRAIADELRAAICRIDGLMAWFRGQLDGPRAEAVPVDVGAFLAEVAAWLCGNTPTGLELHVLRPLVPLRVLAHRRALRKAFEVLIEALAASGPERGGAIEVSAAAATNRLGEPVGVVDIRRVPAEPGATAGLAGPGWAVAACGLHLAEVALPVARDLLRAGAGDVLPLEGDGELIGARVELPLAGPAEGAGAPEGPAGARRPR